LAPPNDLEATILVTLSPGAYTAFLQGKAMTTGIALAQVYDVDPNANTQPTNLSARAFVGTGNDVLIGGTIIGGNPGRIRSRRTLRRPLRHRRTIMNRRSLRCLRRETTPPSLPGKTELRALP